MSFDREFKKAAETVLKASEVTTKSAALELFAAIVTTTPVDTGRLRANWQVSSDYPTSSILETQDISGLSTIDTGQQEINKNKVNQDLYFVNNLPYAYTIEYGRADGTPGSQQAPYGMVRVNVRKFKDALKQQAIKNRPRSR